MRSCGFLWHSWRLLGKLARPRLTPATIATMSIHPAMLSTRRLAGASRRITRRPVGAEAFPIPSITAGHAPVTAGSLTGDEPANR